MTTRIASERILVIALLLLAAIRGLKKYNRVKFMQEYLNLCKHKKISRLFFFKAVHFNRLPD